MLKSKGMNVMRCSPRPLSSIRSFPFQMAFLLACLVCFALPGRAQTGVYAMFSTSDFHANVSRQYGPSFGFYHNLWRPPYIGIGFDARATLLGSGATKAYMGLVGPRLQLRPRVIPLMPYVEGLVGVGDVHVGNAASVVSSTALAYEGAIGVDWTILPRLDWRVVEYSAGGFSSLNASISPRTWSTGLVLRLP